MLEQVHRIQTNRLSQLFLTPPSYLWGNLFQLWLSLHQKGILRAHSLDVPVISVGNITVGGTGKTPFTQWVASHLRDGGEPVGILSRGYLREGKGIAVVSDRETVRKGPTQVGDEPYLLARNLRGVPVVVGKDRFLAGKHMLESFGTRVIILDDGFQYLPLRRNLNILLIDITNPFGNRKPLPAGILREPLKGLSRADLFLLTRVDEGRAVGDLLKDLKELNRDAPIVEAVHRPLELFPLQGGEAEEVGILKGKRVIALSGVGNPASFESTLEGLGAVLVRRLRYPDHHRYSLKDLRQLDEIFGNAGVELIVITEKDGVRLEGLPIELPILVLKVGIDIVKGGHALFESLERITRLTDSRARAR